MYIDIGKYIAVGVGIITGLIALIHIIITIRRGNKK